MSATVDAHMSGGSLANTMREMRTWLDHHKVVPHACRQSTCAQGLAVHIEFNGQRDAEEFASRFGGRVLGARPDWSNKAPRWRAASEPILVRLIFSGCAKGRVPSMCR
jgi:hypothetical protein